VRRRKEEQQEGEEQEASRSRRRRSRRRSGRRNSNVRSLRGLGNLRLRLLGSANFRRKTINLVLKAFAGDVANEAMPNTAFAFFLKRVPAFLASDVVCLCILELLLLEGQLLVDSVKFDLTASKLLLQSRNDLKEELNDARDAHENAQNGVADLKTVVTTLEEQLAGRQVKLDTVNKELAFKKKELEDAQANHVACQKGRDALEKERKCSIWHRFVCDVTCKRLQDQVDRLTAKISASEKAQPKVAQATQTTNVAVSPPAPPPTPPPPAPTRLLLLPFLLLLLPPPHTGSSRGNIK
jgi:hypothetical protein